MSSFLNTFLTLKLRKEGLKLENDSLNSPEQRVCPAQVNISTAPPTDATVGAGEGSIDQTGERTAATGKVSAWSPSAHSSAPPSRSST